MTATLAWPTELPAADRVELRAELNSLIEQVINDEMNALDTLDDQFARMAAALLALLDAHQPDHCKATLELPRSAKVIRHSAPDAENGPRSAP